MHAAIRTTVMRFMAILARTVAAKPQAVLPVSLREPAVRSVPQIGPRRRSEGASNCRSLHSRIFHHDIYYYTPKAAAALQEIRLIHLPGLVRNARLT